MGGSGRGVERSMVAAVVVMLVGLAVGPGEAAAFPGEDPLAVREALGDGIHAFHGGDFARAHEDLTQAIDAGTGDPRAYYFRGLAALRLGRTIESEEDFAAGATRELEVGGTFRISRSLERIQGHDRIVLERYRARARLASIQGEREAYGRRYSTIEDAARDVRRRRRPEDVPAELVAPGPLAAEPEAEEMPAPAPTPEPPAKPDKAPVKKPAESDDPFGDEPEEATPARDGR